MHVRPVISAIMPISFSGLSFDAPPPRKTGGRFGRTSLETTILVGRGPRRWFRGPA